MGGEAVIHDDEVYVHGKDQETARALLAGADLAGVDQHSIRATDEGFICPEAVWDEAQALLGWPDQEPVAL